MAYPGSAARWACCNGALLRLPSHGGGISNAEVTPKGHFATRFRTRIADLLTFYPALDLGGRPSSKPQLPSNCPHWDLGVGASFHEYRACLRGKCPSINGRNPPKRKNIPPEVAAQQNRHLGLLDSIYF